MATVKTVASEIEIGGNFHKANSRRFEQRNLRIGIWIYFMLLIFEGGLRKWVLPSLATPLLIIRDPIAIWLIFLAIQQNILKPNVYLISMITITIVSFFATLFMGHGSLPVALFGARVFLIHFPVIFIIGKVFERRDVDLIGKTLLWLAIPMALLITMQFYSPQSAWVNKGIGSDSLGGGFSGAQGFFRPPATFSFITGTAAFFSLVACFVFYFLLNNKKINRFILGGASIALMASIPLSISRSLFFGVVLTLTFTLFAIFRKPQYLGKMIMVFFVAIAAFVVLGSTDAIKTPLGAFTERFTTANEQEGGLEGVVGDRFLGGMFEAIVGGADQPFFGRGIGMGTNVGAMLLAGTTKTYLIAEDEWGRLLGEQGPLLGLAVIILRLAFCIQLLLASYRRLQYNDLLSWILLSFALINIAQGQWGQPTSLGFSVIVAGLLLASFKGEDPTNLKSKIEDTV